MAVNDRIEFFVKILISYGFTEGIRVSVIGPKHLGKVAFYHWRFCWR